MTKETKHTPGPWKIIGKGAFDDDSIFDYGAAGYAIRAEDHTFVCKIEDCGCEDMNSLNARLIAAAPELLEALKIAEVSMRHCVEGNNPYFKLNMRKVDLPIVQKVIRKAEGIE